MQSGEDRDHRENFMGTKDFVLCTHVTQNSQRYKASGWMLFQRSVCLTLVASDFSRLSIMMLSGGPTVRMDSRMMDKVPTHRRGSDIQMKQH